MNLPPIHRNPPKRPFSLCLVRQKASVSNLSARSVFIVWLEQHCKERKRLRQRLLAAVETLLRVASGETLRLILHVALPKGDSPISHSSSGVGDFFVPFTSISPSLAAISQVRCVIKGRVQGVFYRNWTVENATRLGLKGWVRNRRDGSVEALFSGKPESVDEMQQRCRRGPPDAMVTGFQDFPCSDDPGTRFELKPTI